MVNIIVELSKYLIILVIIMYTYLCFTVFGYHDTQRKQAILRQQNILMFLFHLIAFLVLYLETEDIKMLAFYLAQVVLLGGTIFLYTHIYPRVSRLVVNNMCMLLCVGLVMLTRLNYETAIKQFVIAAGAIALSLVVPVIIRKVKTLANYKKLYAVSGMVSLAIVAVLGQVSYGAKLGFSIGGINVQPSEVVKIIFVFYVAASLKESTEFRHVVVTTLIAAFHVLILVASTDLGAALIIFVVYLVMLYVATRQPLYMVAGLGAGTVASVAGYYLFRHVRTRVNVWKDPFATYDSGGYQVAQSLFAIGTGSWFGMGLCQGSPESIPVRESDFIFSAIAEELGLIFALCLILIFVSCYVMFLNIAMQLRNQFYKLVALGLGTCYIFQVFLNIGGVIKFIPSTGVTLPLVSYGGSSLVSTLIMFAIIQGLYILREDEEERIERKKKEQQLREKRIQAQQLRTSKGRRAETEERAKKGNVPQRPQKRKAPGKTGSKEKAGSKQRIR